MRVEWFGQSAFHLSGDGTTVAIDPFGDMSALSGGRGIQWDYPAISADGRRAAGHARARRSQRASRRSAASRATLRSTAGKLESPLGEVTAVASEHDDVAGTERGPNTIFVFDLDGVRVAHMGDFGQSGLRDEQAAAIGEIDLLFVPVGGGFTIGAEQAAAVVERLKPRWVVPMHYRTPRIGFLEPADEFLEKFERVERLEDCSFETDELAQGDGPLVVVPAAP